MTFNISNFQWLILVTFVLSTEVSWRKHFLVLSAFSICFQQMEENNISSIANDRIRTVQSKFQSIHAYLVFMDCILVSEGRAYVVLL